jgi:hypothetical protein
MFSLRLQPPGQGIGRRSSLLLPDFPTIIGVQVLHLALDVVQQTESLECLCGNLPVMVGPPWNLRRACVTGQPAVWLY